MKLVTKIAAGILLGIGLPITLVAASDLLNPKTAPQDRDGAVAGLLVLGLPPIALGSYLVLSGYRRGQRESRDRLRSTFFQLLKAGDGHVTVLQFAMETGLEGDAAKEYLDQRAREFNAAFNVTEEGKFSYYFDLGGTLSSSLPAASAEETFDVILEFVPTDRQRQVVKAIHDLTGLDWPKAKALVKRLPEPVIVCRSVPRSVAEQYRQKLEAAGADVLVVLK